MTYQVLARKWRPQNFSSLVGQEPIVTALRNALQEGRIAQAYLFSGIRGVMERADDLVEQCLADYDLDGWTDGTWLAG